MAKRNNKFNFTGADAQRYNRHRELPKRYASVQGVRPANQHPTKHRHGQISRDLREAMQAPKHVRSKIDARRGVNMGMMLGAGLWRASNYPYKEDKEE